MGSESVSRPADLDLSPVPFLCARIKSKGVDRADIDIPVREIASVARGVQQYKLGFVELPAQLRYVLRVGRHQILSTYPPPACHACRSGIQPS
jgi:hypothetical protein